MRDAEIDGMLNKLLRLYEEKRQHPFPYDGCRKILKQVDQAYEHLISDLDLYFSAIAGYSSWGKKILKWPKEKVAEVMGKLAKSFFEKHQEYKPLELMITEGNTPDLYANFARYEKIKLCLLQILSQLE